MTDRAAASTGIPGLDDVLRGGLPRNRLYLIQGDPGVGKTTMALQFLLAGAAAGERGLYITLSETRDEINAVASSHGWSLDAIDLFELSAVEQALYLDQESTLFAPSEIELHETTKLLLSQIERVNPSRVVFDSLSELRLLADEPLRYRRQILTLKQYFAGKQCTVLLLDDRTSNQGDLQLQSLAHGVLHLEQLAPEYGPERRRLRVVKLRGVNYRGGNHDCRLVTGGLAVYPSLVAAEHRTSRSRANLASGLTALDELLGGGIDRGSSTLIAGPAGSGKTSLMVQFAVSAANAGGRSVIFSFEEDVTFMVARCEALGMSVRKHIDSGRLEIRQVDAAEMTPGQLAQRARAAAESGDLFFFGIDSLNGYMNAMPEEGFLTLHLRELLKYLAQKNVASMLVMAQLGIVGSMSAPAEVSYVADTVILLRYFEAHGRVRKAISIVKKRGGPHEDSIRELRMSDGSIEVGAPLTEFHGILTGVPSYVGGARQLLGVDE